MPFKMCLYSQLLFPCMPLTLKAGLLFRRTGSFPAIFRSSCQASCAIFLARASSSLAFVKICARKMVQSSTRRLRTGVLMFGVWAGRNSKICGAPAGGHRHPNTASQKRTASRPTTWIGIVYLKSLRGPAAPNTLSKRRGMNPSPSGMVVGAAGAAQTFNIDDCRPTLKPFI